METTSKRRFTKVLPRTIGSRWQTTIALAFGTAFLLAGCGSTQTDFDTFVERHKCQQFVLGGDGDIDMSCIDPANGKRVNIEFEANDRPGQYFTDTTFGGIVWVFAPDEVRDSQAYSKIKKKKK